MSLSEVNGVCDIEANLDENIRGIEGDAFEFCELKDTKFQLGNP